MGNRDFQGACRGQGSLGTEATLECTSLLTLFFNHQYTIRLHAMASRSACPGGQGSLRTSELSYMLAGVTTRT